MTPRQARSLRTQESILDALERLLNADPYGELSMPGIAEAAGVSVGGLYGRFANREQLMDAVHARYQARRDKMLVEKLDAQGETGLSERIGAFVDAFVDLHSRNAGVLRSFIIRHWLTGGAPTHEVLAEVRDHKQRVVDYLLAACPDDERGSRAGRIRRAVEYVISISKDQIVVAPDKPAERTALDLEQLRADLRLIANRMIFGRDP
ncbi:TetR/AcrR family transcriptional regulator [Maricaulis sp.]|uniref:TetR/AcrR family transcriptional regulator n=1 Tax=unclassified Maricaulis TaxID=2632371 RepID=UPI001B02AA9C|nr:TetR/AcrR family transcriptional regulator [Maricaulis sp.]MBO6798045.1 TetR/AcrR family transcriptional regulator [Maricaulis sp.]